MNLLDYLSDKGIAVMTTKADRHYRPGWFQMHCPFCGDGTSKWHLGFNLARKYFSCWACGPKSTWRVLAEILPHENIRTIFEEFELNRPSFALEEAQRRGTLRLPGRVRELSKCHIRYLRERGFDAAELAEIWGLKGIEIASRLSYRVFIPILDHRGRMVSWTTRSTIDDRSPYIAAKPEEEAVDHKTLLYGEHYCTNTVIVCEGPADVWAIGPGAVCTFGKSLKQAQVNRIARYSSRVFVFDDDALDVMVELARELSLYPGKTYTVELAAHDPGSATRREIRKLRHHFLGA